MYNSIHSKFIRTPLLGILEDGINACRGAGCVMEAYPLRDYIMQSLFLKMTGAQEQKLKCLCWEMATNDYTYRYDFLSAAKRDYGEFSKYEQKNNVYKQLIEEIKKYNSEFDIEAMQWIKNVDLDTKNGLFDQEVRTKSKLIIEKKEQKGEELTEEIKNKIRQNIEREYNLNKDSIINNAVKKKFASVVKDNMIAFMESSILSIGDLRNYSLWKENWHLISAESFALKESLLDKKLHSIYTNDVIKHRHKCAHNLTSYQQNLPTFDTMGENDYIYYNYFFRFAILILIDEIFMRLYNEYTEQIEYTPFPI